MGRSPCCSKVGMRRGPWSTNEDNLLTNYIQQHGEGQWKSLPKKAGLLRCGKSCRLRWMNYLRPGIKRGNITKDEEDLIVRLHRLLGNRWSLIAGRLPGRRTDNEIKNHWNTYLRKKVKNSGLHHNNHKSTKIKKTTTGTAKEHEDKDNKLINDTKPTKIKVYAPKPIRVLPQFSSTYSFDSGTSNSDAAEKVVSAMPVAAWPPLFLGGGYINHHSDPISSDDIKMLEQVYDEYLQLL